MKTIPVLLIGALLLIAPLSAAAEAKSAFEQRCEHEMKPRIEVTTHEAGYRIHNTVSSRLLSNRGSYVTIGQSVMGLTSSHTRAEIGLDGPMLIDKANGRECVGPRISVELSYQPVDVYVAREFSPYSCSFRVVVTHELLHVKIYHDQLPRIEARVRGELTRRYGGRPIYAVAGEGLSTLENDIDTWLRPLIKAELAEVEVAQRELDSRDEEQRLSQACQGEVAMAMGSTF